MKAVDSLERRPVIIAEIGCNHKGDMDIAREMIRIAKVFCGVDYVKFQKRDNILLLSEEERNAPHPEPYHAYGGTYGEHRDNLELSLDQHKELKDCCDQTGVGYTSSVWDLSSFRDIAQLKPDFIKVPSAQNTNEELMAAMCGEFEGGIHVSLGMTTKQEEERLISLLESRGRLGDTVLYHCVSGYPVPPEDICLLEIKRIREDYGDRVADIGFSAHYTGIALDPVAYALGATYIERHFTLDRAWRGTDHAASLEPDGMRRVVKNTNALDAAYHFKPREILEIEEAQRKKLKFKSGPEQ